MSVAFRRESDDEHKEPVFELPIPPGPNLVTPRGLALLEARVAELEAALPPAGPPEVRADAERTLRYWRTRLATAQLAPAPAAGEAGIGSHVRFRLDGRERAITIVGGDEAAPAEGRIAFSAPLAAALIGAAAGDRVDFGGRAEVIEVMGVEPA